MTVRALDHASDMQYAMAIARKFRTAATMTDAQLREDPFVLWMACLFDRRAREALACVSPTKER